jgi:hypothetical protein
MKAWRFYGFSDMRLDDVPEAVCGPGQVLVEPLCVQPSVTEAQLAQGIPTLALTVPALRRINLPGQTLRLRMIVQRIAHEDTDGGGIGVVDRVGRQSREVDGVEGSALETKEVRVHTLDHLLGE